MAKRRNLTRAQRLADVKKRIVPVSEANPYVKVLAYGRNGHGKTRFGASGPNTLIVDINEEGTRSVRDSDSEVFPARTWEDLVYLYWYLRDGDHSYETVVIDTLTQAQGVCMAHVLKRAEDRDPNRPPSMPDRRAWGQLGELIKPWILDMRNLQMHVVFLCQIRRIEEGEDEQIEVTYSPDLSPSVRGTAMASCGIMGYIFKRKVRVGKVTKGRTKGKETTAWKTLMLVGPHEKYETKDRTNALGHIVQDPTMPLVIETWREYGPGDDEE